MPYTTPTYLTSQPYPVDVVEKMKVGSPGPVHQPYYDGSLEEMTVGAALMAGVLAGGLYEYTNWPVEQLQTSAEWLSGTLALGLTEYTNWPVESLQVGQAQFLAGSLAPGLIVYTNWPIENLKVGAAFIAGTIT